MILFIVDAGSKTGYGRLVRSLVLARNLKKNGPVSFSGILDRIAQKQVEKSGFSHFSTKELSAKPGDHFGWIVLDAIPSEPAEALIRKCPNTLGSCILQIRESEAEKIISEKRIDLFVSSQVPNPSEPFAGLLLHTQFRHFHTLHRKYAKRARSVLLFISGDPDYHQLRDLIDMLIRHSFHLKVAGDFMVKKAHKKGLRRLYPGLRFSGDCQSLARSLFEADLALITPGQIAAEAAAVGTPAVYLSQTPQHQEATAFWQQNGAGISAGAWNEISEERLIPILESLRLEKAKREAMGEAGKRTCDARGLFHILEIIHGAKPTP